MTEKQKRNSASQVLSDEQILEILRPMKHDMVETYTRCFYEDERQEMRVRGAGVVAFARAILAQQAATPAEAAREPVLNVLRRALEVIAVGDSNTPTATAAHALVATGLWTTEQTDALAQQPAKSAEALPLARPGRWRDGDACDEGQPAKSEAAQHATEATRNQGMSDAEINEITTASLGKWPSFKAQSWACKVAHAVLSHATQLEQKVGLTFEQAWAEKAAQGYNYGEDALENVRLGFEMARAAPSATVDVAESGEVVEFQQRVQPWMQECFGPVISADTTERNHRFFEESAELVQACGMTRSEAHQLVDYVFGRPTGEKSQEVGGVMVTLAALCLAQGIDMHAAGETELARIWTKVEQIRAKQAAKPKHSPLPEHVVAGVASVREAPLQWLDQSTASNVEKARRALGHLIKPDAVYFFEDGFPRCNVIAADVACVLHVLNGLAAAPTPAAPDDVARDAERYRWLRNVVLDERIQAALREGDYWLDEAIDAPVGAAAGVRPEEGLRGPLTERQRSDALSLYASLPHNIVSGLLILQRASVTGYANGFQDAKDAAGVAIVPTFKCKHVRVKQMSDGKIMVTMITDAFEGAPNYAVQPINPAAVRAAPTPTAPDDVAALMLDELFDRQQAGFERCFEELGINDDRERSWSSLVLAIEAAIAASKAKS